MKAIVYKIFYALKNLFLRLRVAVELHIGRERSDESNSEYEDSHKDD